MDAQPLVRPIQIRLRTPTLCFGDLSLGRGVPRFYVGPSELVNESHGLMWPLQVVSGSPTLRSGYFDLCSRTSMLKHGPFSCDQDVAP